MVYQRLANTKIGKTYASFFFGKIFGPLSWNCSQVLNDQVPCGFCSL